MPPGLPGRLTAPIVSAVRRMLCFLSLSYISHFNFNRLHAGSVRFQDSATLLESRVPGLSLPDAAERGRADPRRGCQGAVADSAGV